METKTCCTCKIDKKIDEFSYKNKENEVYQCSCKECWKETRKRNYEKNKKITFDRNNRKRTNLRKWFEEYKKTLSCIQCGENHPACLDFHHIDSKTKEHTISLMIGGTYSIDAVKKEIDKCEVLCANCHRKLHYEEVTEQRYKKWIKNEIPL